MYIKFKTLKAQSYRCFRDLSFNLDRSSGLYFIYGENKYEPRQEGNGSGKSTSFDALNWCLEGNTLRGVIGGHIKSWFDPKKTCKVESTLEIDGVPHTLIRTHSPITLLLDSETIVQSKIDDLTKHVLESVIVGQFHKSFLFEKPSDRLKIFSDIMNLEKWEKASEIAKRKKEAVERTIIKLEDEITAARTNISEKENQIAQLQNKCKGFEEERTTALSLLNEKAVSLGEQINKLLGEKSRLDASIKDITGKLTGLQALRISKDVDREYVKSEASSLSIKITELKTQIDSEKKIYNKWKNLPDFCNSCGQPTSKEIAGVEKAKITRQILSLTADKDKLNAEYQELFNRLTAIQLEFKDLDTDQTTLNEQLKSISKDSQSTSSSYILKLQELQQVQTDIQNKQNQSNLYSDLISDLESQNVTLTHYLETKTDVLLKSNREFDGYAFWIKGFKELRLWLISEALNSLEIEANNALIKLGLLDWSIKFTVEKETAKGTLTKGLHILIESKLNKTGLVPLEMYSGGQTGRLSLATILAFISFTQSYKGITSNIECWDEPVSYISPGGINEFIEFLAERAKELNKTIYYIDQREISNPSFNGIIKFTFYGPDRGSVISEDV